ncbi:hypothetical protein FNB15_01570 [Ferrovibrio terrae]|uniref:Glycosyltransferase family 8 protein n=1 Tax=Ferrovibrio terrae TaxID=2594003 RepID=A0A516GWW7_9PROT|nr:hypothetical protein [Ferrovibrio terrae]QDO96043.1 hypothetical protein FNB15_01570 [Ferrovibrio terrae]
MFVLDTPESVVPHTGRKTAIVTLIIGPNYIATWLRLCRASWLRYARTFDYDVIIISQPLDTGSRAQARSPAWQKLLILSQPWSAQYERIVWIDSDIIIGPEAQDIVASSGPPEKISLAVAGARSSSAERMIYLERLHNAQFLPDAEDMVWEQEIRKNYRDHNVPEHDIMFNTGVLVVSPRHHRDLFLHCYDGEDAGARLYEQPLLSHEIIERDLGHLLNTRFNWGIQETLLLYVPEILIWDNQPKHLHPSIIRMAHYLVRRELQNCYFLHFYGAMNLMATLTEEHVFGGTPLDLLMDEAAKA